MEDWLKQDETSLMHVYGRMPFVPVKGEGHYLYDEKGEAHLDLFCGVGVNNLGHRHPQILEAIEKQMNQFLHISNNFVNPNAVAYANSLVEQTFGEGRVFFGNSGTEASETAIKLVHKWTKNRNEENRGILVLKDGYHGRTMGSLQLTRQEHVYQDFPTTTMPFYEVEINDHESLIQTVQTHRPHAIMIETVLGAGGVYPLSHSFLETIQMLVTQHDMLLIVDEVQTGFGRTGTFFSYEQTPLQPHMIIFAKACGGGLPLSGVIANEQVGSLFHVGDHGTTFGPNPLSIASGRALFSILQNTDAIENARIVSDMLYNQLQDVQNEFPALLQDIRHKGMMFGITFDVSPSQMKEMQHAMIQKHVLVDVTKQTTMRLLPPLTLTEKEVSFFIQSLSEVLHTFSKEHQVSK